MKKLVISLILLLASSLALLIFADHLHWNHGMPHSLVNATPWLLWGIFFVLACSYDEPDETEKNRYPALKR